MNFTPPPPTNSLECFEQANALAEQGNYLEAALRYLVIAGVVGSTEMEARGVDQEAMQAFIAALMIAAFQIRKEQARRVSLN